MALTPEAATEPTEPKAATEPEPESEESQSLRLYRAFRSIILLLTLVTTINGDGESILQSYTQTNFKPALDESSKARDNAMHAIATLLVRHGEVVAAIARNLYKSSASERLSVDVVAAVSGVPNASLGSNGEEYYMDFDEVQYRASDVEGILSQFTAIGNPEESIDKKDRIGAASDSSFTRVSAGDSHFDIAKSGYWTPLFAISLSPLLCHAQHLTYI